VLVRTCWEYHIQLDAFQNWLDRTENADVVLLNPADTIRRTHLKFYLCDLEQRGVSILPTAWIERSTEISLRTVLGSNGREEVVVIPNSTSEAHIRETYEAQHLTRNEDDIARIDAIERTARQIDFDEAP